MTITPDQADQWAQRATDGPWSIDPDYGTVEPDVISGEGCRFEASDEDLALIAAAPDLARTIAGMRWEYAVEHLGHVSPWGSRESAEDDLRYYLRTSMFIPHLVRRLVGPVEPISKETPND